MVYGFKRRWGFSQIKSLHSESLLVTSGVFSVTLQDDVFPFLFVCFLFIQSKENVEKLNTSS